MMNIEKVTEIAAVLLLCVILAVGGIIAGIQIEQNHVTKKLQSETVTKIAVVNLDEGIKNKEKQVFYAERLMELSNENLIVDNLESARRGINNGTYAGYIIIPADFSKDATSLNSNPEKSIITYALNPNLREDVGILTLTQIRDFELSLSTNMSYMYVEAILNEFHDVQDSANTIMDNDNKDLNNLNSIDPNALMQTLEYTPLDTVDFNIENLDLNKEFSSNTEVVNAIKEDYKKFSQDGKDAFSLIKQDEGKVTGQIQELNAIMQSVDFQKNEDGDIVYQNGVSNIENEISNYDLEITTSKNEIRAKLGLVPPESLPSGASGEQTLLDSNALQTRVDDELLNISNDLDSSVSAYNTQLASCKTNISGDIDDLIIIAGTQAEKDALGEIKTAVNEIEAIDDISIASQEIDIEPILHDAFNDLMTEIDAYPTISTDSMKTKLADEVISPIADEIAAENNKVKTKTESLTTELTTYSSRIAEFDPFKYYDEGKISSQMEKFSGNVFDIQSKSMETNTKYLDYVNDVYTTTNDNVITLQKNLNDAYKVTTENVNFRIDQAKEDRRKINEINIALLKDFSKKLPYTRLGELEYTQAYDFIVNPVVAKDESIMQSDFSLFADVTLMKQIYFGIVCVWILCVGYLATKRMVIKRAVKKA